MLSQHAFRRRSLPADPEPLWLDGLGAAVLCAGLFGCLFASLAGCSGEVRAELLEVEQISPTRVAPGTRIAIDGVGLPVATEAALVLEGTLHTPQGTRALSARLPAEILTEERAEVLLTGALFDDLIGGRGTFEGQAVLAVAMAGGAGELTGTVDDVTLDFVLGEGVALLELDEATATGLGLEAERREGALVVTRADEPAARWGVAQGDVLVAIDGLHVLEPADLSGWSERPTSIEVLRDGVPLTLGPRTAEPAPDQRLRTGELAVLAVVLTLLLRIRPPRREVEPTSRRPSRKQLLGSAISVALFAALGALVPRLAITHFPALLAPASFVIVLVAGVRSVRRDGHLGAVAGGLLRAASLLAAVLFAALARGVTDLGELLAIQGPLPWQWALSTSAVAPALVVLLALAMPDAPRDRVDGVLGRLHEAALLTVVVVTLAGGAEPGLLGIGSFVLRLLALRALLAVVAEGLAALVLPSRLSVLLGAVLVAALPALTALAVIDGPLAELLALDALPRASAETWLTAAVVGLALMLTRGAPREGIDREVAL